MAIRRLISSSLSVVIIRQTFCGGQIFIVHAKGGKRKIKKIEKKDRLKLGPNRASRKHENELRLQLCHIREDAYYIYVHKNTAKQIENRGLVIKMWQCIIK
jgi:hypothetical protein